MTNITIDNTEYNFDDLSDEAKNQLNSLKFVESELFRLQAQVAAMQTARIAYGNALKNALPAKTDGDTIKFN